MRALGAELLEAVSDDGGLALAHRLAHEGLLDLSMEFDAKTAGLRCRPSVFLMRGKTIIYRSLYPEFVVVNAARRLTWAVRIPTQMLPGGTYTLMINMQTLQGDIVYAMKAQDAVTLTIRRASDAAGDESTKPVLALPLRLDSTCAGLRG